MSTPEPRGLPAGYARPAPGTDAPLISPAYRSTAARAPSRPLVALTPGLNELTGPLFGMDRVRPGDADLSRGPSGDALGQRIVVAGRVLDADGRPIPDALIEIWQANASGRYHHERDNWPAPLDPNFSGGGRTVTDEEGHYRFLTIKPGAYPWANHVNAWRPAHIHVSLFGRSFSQRLVTQMYFPDDPLFFQDPILGAIPDPAARRRLVSAYDHALTEAQWALGFRWDIVLRGPLAVPFEPLSEQDHHG